MQTPRESVDTILINGKITTLSDDGAPSEAEALAIRDDKIVAVGSTDDMLRIAGPLTRRIDLLGHRAVPGLIDTHVHAVRAGRTWNDEVRWENETTLDSALSAIAEEADPEPSTRWIRVIGGWHPHQFSERRGPTRAELDAVAPNNPTFVQFAYEWAVLNSEAMKTLRLDESFVRDMGADNFERTADGELTGKIYGMDLMRWLYAQLPLPTFEDQVASTASLFGHLNTFGITGVIDGGGANTGPDVYGAVREAWRRDLLTVRTRLMVHPSAPGTETEEYEGYRRFTPLDVGDHLLRVLGAGEVILYQCADGLARDGDTSEATKRQLRQILTGLAEDRWTVHMHAHQKETIQALLEVWESLNKEIGIDHLRWSVVHGESIDEEDIPRLKAIGAGLLNQGLYRFSGDRALEMWGEKRVADSPPIGRLKDAGVPFALGSDGMRAASYNPFVSMAWYTTGYTLTGRPTLAPHNLLTREEALRGYTSAASWFSFEEDLRGRIRPGYLADIAVLDRDYFSVPDDEVEATRSVLTVVGGRIVHSADPLSTPQTDQDTFRANVNVSRY